MLGSTSSRPSGTKYECVATCRLLLFEFCTAHAPSDALPDALANAGSTWLPLNRSLHSAALPLPRSLRSWRPRLALQATVKGFIDARLAVNHAEAAELLRAYSWRRP